MKIGEGSTTSIALPVFGKGCVVLGGGGDLKSAGDCAGRSPGTPRGATDSISAVGRGGGRRPLNPRASCYAGMWPQPAANSHAAPQRLRRPRASAPPVSDRIAASTLSRACCA